MGTRCPKAIGREGFGGLEHLGGGAGEDYFAAVFAAVGADVDEPVGLLHDVEVVLDDYQGVSSVDNQVEKL